MLLVLSVLLCLRSNICGGFFHYISVQEQKVEQYLGSVRLHFEAFLNGIGLAYLYV